MNHGAKPPQQGRGDVLRLPPFSYHKPSSVAEATGLMDQYAEEAMYVAGGTDLIPNMKHRLFEPTHLIALKSVTELSGIREENGDLRIGSAETLAEVAGHPEVQKLFPALADAAGHVAGPQLRNAGTIGGNLCLDTRCTYYNQTSFWRGALGYCLKKDGTVCHVTNVGKKCVAAHSADTPPVLMTLGAMVTLAGPDGERRLPIEEFFITDGIYNTRRTPAEIVTEICIPVGAASRRQAYAKLRQRKSIDFPLLTVAVSADIEGNGTVQSINGVVTALGARPRALSGWDDLAVGGTLDADMIDELAERAHEQCHPLENLIVDADWRRAMVPVYVRRVLEKLLIT
ncbi:MAG TPA: 4-hydroxybenzoyl-CoA reductase [Gemmatimonadetes bacterium]|nr:4-hydroxybenzoyl-CoA reductase [Gemmatimonadota bacterium]